METVRFSPEQSIGGGPVGQALIGDSLEPPMPAAMKPGDTWLSRISSRGLASFFPFPRLKVPGFRTNVTLPVRQSAPEESICLLRGADTVRLVDRLLQHLATPGADALEGGVAVVGPEEDSEQQALRRQGRPTVRN